MTANIVVGDIEKIKINENLYQYYFLEDGERLVNSIFACVDGDRRKALIIDTAYREFSLEIKKDLAANDIEPEAVVLSHYHPDHAGGLEVFSDCRTYAGEFYGDNYDNCKRWRPDLNFVRPTHTLKDGDTMTFGTFRLKFLHAPGHSYCSMLVSINDDFLYIGDLLMFGVDGRLTLPYISMGGGFKEHIDSLEKIKTLDFNVLSCTHGRPLRDRTVTHEKIDDWVHYLKRTLNSSGTLPLEVCLKNDISAYTATHHHDNNLMYLM